MDRVMGWAGRWRKPILFSGGVLFNTTAVMAAYLFGRVTDFADRVTFGAVMVALFNVGGVLCWLATMADDRETS